jgi:hypothetical protein
MNFAQRIDASIESTHSFPTLRELELRKLILEDSALVDAIKLFAFKVSHVQGNMNAVLNLANNLLWDLMTVMWDNDYLISKKRLMHILHGNLDIEPGRPSAAEELLRMKDLELRSAADNIKSLQQQLIDMQKITLQPIGVLSCERIDVCNLLKQMGTSLTQESMSAIKLPEDTHTSTDSSVRESGVIAHASIKCAASRAESLGTHLESRSSQLRSHQGSSNRTASDSFTILEEASIVTPLTPLAEVDCFSSTLERETESATLSDAETRVATSHLSRSDELRLEEVQLMKQRERDDEFRINELLSEIVEKDEIISVITDELKRVSARVREFGTSPRRSTAPNSRRASDVDMLLGTKVSTTVANALKEREAELIEYRTQNEALRMHVADLESYESGRFRIYDMRRPHMVDNLCQVTTRCLESVECDIFGTPPRPEPCFIQTKGDILEITASEKISELECALLKSIDEERKRTSDAMEETKRVKYCLNELERQLAALQFQLRRSGVKQEHIRKALAKSGLTTLMQASRSAVFERLYRDAVDRMKRMELVRQQVTEIQARQFIKKFSSGTSLSVFDGAVRVHPAFRPSTVAPRVHILGGGFLLGNNVPEIQVKRGFPGE